MMKKITFLILLIPFVLFSQEQKLISGTIIDQDFDDYPVVSASVYASSNLIVSETEMANVVEGTMIGAVTDFDGNFSFYAPADVKYIIVSHISYETRQIDVSEKSTDLAIKLKAKSETLDEVVITGYQKIEKRKMTSSYTKVKTEDIKRAGIANVDQMLSGNIAGVSIQSNTGSPGSPVKVQIRGVSTLSGSSEPLWVLDGIPLEGNDVPKDFTDKDNLDELKSYAIAGVNPEDIEDITILKDASATSIYGARAANGVIVITTKKGKKGNMHINFSANSFIAQEPDFGKLNLMNSDQKVDFELYLASRKDLKYQSNRGEVARILNKYKSYEIFQDKGFNAIPVAAQNAINNLRTINTDWGDELYQSPINKQYNLSASGGGDLATYYASLGYFDEEGSTYDTGLKRYNVTLKNTFFLTDKLNIGLSLFGNQNKKTSYITGMDNYTNPAYYSRRANPYLKILDDNGAYIYDPDLIERLNTNLDYNILEERNNTSYRLISNSFKPIIDVNYDLHKNLRLYSQLGMQFSFDNTEKIALADSYFRRKLREKSRYKDKNGEEAYFLPDGGVIENYETNLFQYNWKTTANYSATFNDLHELDVMAGAELRSNEKTSIMTRSFGYNPNTLLTVPITNPLLVKSINFFKPYSKTFNENAFVSFFGTSSYTFNKKYTVFCSLRFDGSNLFGVDPRYRYLPLWSVAGSWDLKRENLFHNWDFLATFKLRGSYGVQGNVDKNTSPNIVGQYNEVSILPNEVETVIEVTNPPNKYLRWEKTKSYNVGLDLGLLYGRVNILADYYKRRSTDLIGLKSVPLESGFTFVNKNWATISNEGIELGLSFRNVDHKHFKWTTNFNISHNKNLVEKNEIHEQQGTPSLEGYSVDAVFALKTAGLDSNGLPIFVKDGKKYSAVDFFNLEEGVDGKQLTNQEHRDLFTYIGNSSPKYTGGFINNFKIGQFNLNVATNFIINKVVKARPTYHMTYVQPGTNYSTDVLKAGTGNMPALIGYNTKGFDTSKVYTWFSTDDYQVYRYLDIWMKKMSYIRINSIRLAYNFPKTYLDRLNLATLSMSIEGRNLFVFGTDYKGYFDPETYGNPYAQPMSKVWSFGFNLSF